VSEPALFKCAGSANHFGVSRFLGKSYYGGHFGSDNDNNVGLFSAGGMDFIVISLEYDTTPDQSVLAGTFSSFERRKARAEAEPRVRYLDTDRARSRRRDGGRHRGSAGFAARSLSSLAPT
jgi:hypothetical protein